MSLTLKRLVSGSQLTGAAATYYTAPTNTKATIKSAVLTNTTGGAVACTVYLVPSAGTAGATNTLISAYNVAAGAAYTCPELINMVIEAGGTIQALGLNVTLVVSGAEVV